MEFLIYNGFFQSLGLGGVGVYFLIFGRWVLVGGLIWGLFSVYPVDEGEFFKVSYDIG